MCILLMDGSENEILATRGPIELVHGRFVENTCEVELQVKWSSELGEKTGLVNIEDRI